LHPPPGQNRWSFRSAGNVFPHSSQRAKRRRFAGFLAGFLRGEDGTAVQGSAATITAVRASAATIALLTISWIVMLGNPSSFTSQAMASMPYAAMHGVRNWPRLGVTVSVSDLLPPVASSRSGRSSAGPIRFPGGDCGPSRRTPYGGDGTHAVVNFVGVEPDDPPAYAVRGEFAAGDHPADGFGVDGETISGRLD
jgi:hypothetical protein